MKAFPQFNSFGMIDRDFDTSHEDSEILDQSGVTRPPIGLSIIGLLALATLIGSLFYYQIVKGGTNFLLAEKNRIRLERVVAPRGVIYDRNLSPLVRNIASYDLVIFPQNLPAISPQKEQTLSALAQLTGLTIESIKEKLELTNSSLDPVVIAQNLNQDQALKYQTLIYELPGVEVVKLPIRSYFAPGNLAHILGYVGKADQQFLKNHPEYNPTALVGKTNAELLYEQFLKGKDGIKREEVDAKGRLQRVLANIPPRQGNNLVLTIDHGLQQVLSQSLQEGLNAAGVTKAAAIAIQPKNGEILALVSLPSFDNNIFLSGDSKAINQVLTSPNQPLVNRAVAGLYPSGSTIKPVWAAAALQEKIINERFKIDTPPEISIGEFVFPDWKDHGTTDIKTAIAESNNIFFYGLTGGWGPIKGLGINRLVEYMQRVGFGELSDIDLTGEKAGFVPTPAWKKKIKNEPWYIGDTYHLGIGQGDIVVTPLQLLLAQTTIVNGGKLVTPHIAKKITDPEGGEIQTIAPPPKREGVFGDEARQVTMAGMRQTVTAGSARQLADLPVEALAKTGTAQFGNQGRTHAWFVAFAPYHDPQIGIIVLVEGGGEGHAVAQPVAKKALQWWFGR